MNHVVVADLETPHEALLVRGMLRAHGIPAEVAADGHPLPSTFTGRPAGTAVVVNAEDAEDARALLAEVGASPVEGDDAGATPSKPPTGDHAPAPRTDRGPSPRQPAPDEPRTSVTPSAPAQIPTDAPLAATRARRSPWALAAVVALVVLIGWLLLEATNLGVP